MAFLGKNLQMETIPEPPKGPLRRPELLALAADDAEQNKPPKAPWEI